MVREIYHDWISPQRWLERVGIRAPMQIVIGLMLLTICVLLIAKDLKFLPSEEDELLRTRASLAEMVSRQVAQLTSQQDKMRLRNLLDALVGQDGVLSACVRRQDGGIVAQTAEHSKYWVGAAPDESTLTHIRVGLQKSHKQWGELQIAFSTLQEMLTWRAWWHSPTVQLTAFMLAVQFILFWLFLSRMLTMLDPSSVIPNRMQLLMDTLVEGMVLLDNQGSIVMANQSFAQTAFLSIEHLIGRKLSSLPWLARDDESGTTTTLPWEINSAGDMQQRGVPMRLRIGSRHERRLNVNVSPVLGTDGKHHGTLITFDDQTILEEDNLQMSQMLARFGNAGEQIRQLREHLGHETNRHDLETLDELAQVAAELAQICHRATQETKTTLPSTEEAT